MDSNKTIICTHKNNIMLHKQFSITKIYQVKINTNATNIKHIEPWLNDNSFIHINALL